MTDTSAPSPDSPYAGSPHAESPHAAPTPDASPFARPLASEQPLATSEDPSAPPVEYDPADYRWVPVRRQPRYDGWTEEKQRRFIEVLADTGLVNAAAKSVGMTRESAYRLRRSAHAAAFARAWDAARHHAGSTIEDIAFERAIEGVEHNVFDENGGIVCTKRVYNDRLLTFLLTHLKPERYAKAARARPEPAPEPVDAVLAALEPALPAPPEALLDGDTLAHELELADMADGELPHFLTEQRSQPSAAVLAARARVEQQARGQAAFDKVGRPGAPPLDDAELRDLCAYLDPTQANELGRRRFR